VRYFTNIMSKNKIKDLLRPAFYYCKDIFDFAGNKRLKKNIELYNRHLGNRAFLLCTGESIQHINIEQLKNEYTFGINLIFIHEDIKKIDLSYYVYLDTNRNLYSGMPQWPAAYLGPLGHKPIRQIYEEIDKRVDNNTKLILNSESFKYADELFINKTKYYTKVQKKLNVINGVPYSIIADMTSRTISGGGSIYFTILIMIYMGFKEIYLCGAGYTYKPVYQLHFYDNFVFPRTIGKERAVQEIKKEIINQYGNDGAVEYFGVHESRDLFRGVCVTKESPHKDYETHIKMNEYAKSKGVKIINIVPEGFESPVYEKIAWVEVVDNIINKRN